MHERLLKRSETSGRPDDNIETIQKRFATFVEKTLPVVGHYEELNKINKVSVSSVSADHHCYVKVSFSFSKKTQPCFQDFSLLPSLINDKGSDRKAEKREHSACSVMMLTQRLLMTLTQGLHRFCS